MEEEKVVTTLAESIEPWLLRLVTAILALIGTLLVGRVNNRTAKHKAARQLGAQ